MGRKKLFALFVLTILVFLGVAVIGTGASLSYYVTIPKNESNIHVRAVVNGLNSTKLHIQFKNEARYVSEYVSDMGVPSGKIHNVETGRWQVDVTGSNLTYEYDIAKVIPWNPTYNWGSGNEIAVHFDSKGGVVMAPYLFIYPQLREFQSIQLQFEVPSGWKTVTPYLDKGDHYEVERITDSLMIDFLNRQQIYLGEMEFYDEKTVGNCTVKFGRLATDDNPWELKTQKEVTKYVDATAKTVSALTDLFGDNPYSTFVMYSNFKQKEGNTYKSYPGTRYMGNGYQYWPEHRWDELVGHAILSWVGRGLLQTSFNLEKGMFEDYYGQTLAWRLFDDPAYLAKMYYYYLTYEWMYNRRDRDSEDFVSNANEYNGYFRWEFISLLLDKKIKAKSEGKYSLDDVVKWLYSNYAKTEQKIGVNQLQLAINIKTGLSLNPIFAKYVRKDNKLPVYQYLNDYKKHFKNYPDTMEKNFLFSSYNGHTIPFFIQIVMATSLSDHYPMGLFVNSYPLDFARHILKNNKIDNLTREDVTSALTEITSTNCSDFFTYWENSYGELSLNSIKDWLHDVKRKI